MNHHLNLFRFFNESTETEFIENNLSRAFSLCLTNNSMFLNEYLRSVILEEDYLYLFSSVSSDTIYAVDIQIDTATIDRESYKTVYAVAMTSDRALSMEDFLKQEERKGKRNVTDIFISIKDVAIIIEVKRNAFDCKAQLFNQILPSIGEKEKFKIIPKNHSWQEVIKLLEMVKHVQQLSSQNSIFIEHFLELSELRYPEWFEPKPFNVIPFSNQLRTTNNIQLQKRMRQALAGVAQIAGVEYQLLPYGDRLGITAPFGWASEIIPVFETYEDDIKQYITFYVWPGNTKQQGYQVYNKPLNWISNGRIAVNGIEYEMEVVFNIKLCHFNRFIAGINFYPDDVIKPLHTPENFYNQSGKWQSESWDDFEELMDEHFKPQFNWKSHCDWEDNFLNTDRSYFTMSLGFEVAAYIPFSKFRAMDKRDTDVAAVSSFITEIVRSFSMLLR